MRSTVTNTRLLDIAWWRIYIFYRYLNSMNMFKRQKSNDMLAPVTVQACYRVILAKYRAPFKPGPILPPLCLDSRIFALYTYAITVSETEIFGVMGRRTGILRLGAEFVAVFLCQCLMILKVGREVGGTIIAGNEVQPIGIRGMCYRLQRTVCNITYRSWRQTLVQ